MTRTETFADFLLTLECPRCHANSYNLTIHKRYRRLWLLMCNRCSTLFALYDGILDEKEKEFLLNAGYLLEPLQKLDFKKERKLAYVS